MEGGNEQSVRLGPSGDIIGPDTVSEEQHLTVRFTPSLSIRKGILSCWLRDQSRRFNCAGSVGGKPMGWAFEVANPRVLPQCPLLKELFPLSGAALPCMTLTWDFFEGTKHADSSEPLL